MLSSSSSIPLQDLVLVGGGHAHVHVLKMLGMNRSQSHSLQHLRVTLVSRDALSPYSGMIPGYICGYYSKEQCHIDLFKTAAFAGVRFIHCEVNAIDTDKQMVFFADPDRPPIRYDLLSIDIGITPSMNSMSVTHSTNGDANANANANAADSDGHVEVDGVTPVKPIDRFADRWERVVQKISAYCDKLVVEGACTPTPLQVAIVGGGGGGVELAFSMDYRLKQIVQSRGFSPQMIQVSVYNRGEDIMTSHSKSVRNTIKRLLEEKQINIFNSTEIVSIVSNGQKRQLQSKDGTMFPFDEAFWCTQASTQSWLRHSGLALDDDGFILVQPTLESVNVKGVFACGDVCHNVKYPRPKAGVFAVRAGPPLFNNLKHWLYGEELEEWVPQEEFLGIINTGNHYAVASKGGMCVEGAYIFTLKDKIDVTWMEAYQNLPSMEEMLAKQEHEAPSSQPIKSIAKAADPSVFELLAKAKMRCAGCGSKVGSTILNGALKRVKAMNKFPHRPEVMAGIGDDAAIIVPPAAPGCIVQTIDYFKSFVSDPYLFGKIAANHALSDIFAMNGNVVTAMALCVLPYGNEDMVEDELVQMLAGMLTILRRENCALVGGHTAEGSEAALGLSVTGFIKDPSDAFPKGPLFRDCSIVVTKGIGTGTILAADMRARAKGGWVSAAYESMLLSNAPAAKILSNQDPTCGGLFQCKACTDVTGFGLLGHLIEMIQYTNENDCNSVDQIAVDLFLNNVPTLPGAIECVKMGILSTLHPQNIRCNQVVGNIAEASKNEIYPLLFDPQTSGGLLICVPTTQVDEIVRALRSGGYPATAEIGRTKLRSNEEFATLVDLIL